MSIDLFFRMTDDFLQECEKRHGNVSQAQYHHPAGEDIRTITALVGPRNPRNLLVVISGTHGPEGFIGSMAQQCWIREFAEEKLPPETGVLLVHGLNCWGMRHIRRTCEGNEDLNRNCIPDFREAPLDSSYGEVATFLYPDEPLISGVLRLQAELYDKEHGAWAFLRAATQGQYTHPTGLFYGGSRPAWSRITLEAILQGIPSSVERIVLMDIHTGLGRWEDCEMICPWPVTDPAFEAAAHIFKEHNVRSPLAQGSVTSMVEGNVLNHAARLLGEKLLTAVAPEFGTYPPMEVLTALASENKLYHSSPGTAPHHEAQRRLLEMFFPNDPTWRRNVVATIIDQMRLVLHTFDN